MSIYFSTNVPELRSILQFNRLSLQIARSTAKLETGQRILRAADDPSGLIAREPMRADMKAIQSAQRNTSTAQSILNSADAGMASIVRTIEGDMDDDSGMNLIGIVNDSRIDSEMKKSMISDILNVINGIASSTTYGGKQIINGGLSYSTSGVDWNATPNLQIYKATSPTTVEIQNTQTAQRGKLYIDNTGFDNADESTRAKVGDTITVGLQNRTQVSYTLQDGDVDDGTIVGATVAARMGDVLKGSGVTASADADGNLVFQTEKLGSEQHLTVNSNALISGTTKNQAGKVATDTTGRDAKFNVNGREVSAKNLNLSVSTSELGFTTGITESFATTDGARQTFKITGGGATFQLGENVVSDMQLKMGIPSVNSAFVGGKDGMLNDLLDLDYDNADDVGRANNIVNQAISSITQNRARIGVIQNSVLESNSIALDDRLLQVTEAEALISNTDTALESSKLSRLELLAQSAMNAILYNRSFAQFAASLF